MQAIDNVNRPFQAEWPKNLEETTLKKIAKVVYDIFSVIIFPIGLARLVGYLLSLAAVPLIIPASKLKLDPDDAESNIHHVRDLLLQNSMGSGAGEEISATTPDGLKLNGALFEGKDPQKYILFCNPNRSPYEQIGTRYLRLVEDVGCSAVMFNPRGVVKSEGSPTSQGLALDVYTMFEYLVSEKGIDPNNIVIYGFSLGGATGSMGGKLVQEKYPDAKIKMCSERSFDNLASEAYSLVRDYVGVPVFAQIAGVISYLTIHAIGWQMNAKASFDSIQGKKLIIYHKKDGVIPYEASLYKSVKHDIKTGANEGDVTRIKLRDEFAIDLGFEPYHFHTRSFKEKEADLIVEEIKLMLGIEVETPIVEGQSPIRKKIAVAV